MAERGGTISGPDFVELLNDVEDFCEDIEKHIEFIYQAAREQWPWLGTVVDAVTGVISKIRELWRKFKAAIAVLLKNPGAPATLWSHGDDWSGTPVGERVSTQAGLATENSLRIDDYWTGIAADAYSKTLGPQKDALASIKSVADDIDDLLFKAGGGRSSGCGWRWRRCWPLVPRSWRRRPPRLDRVSAFRPRSGGCWERWPISTPG